MASPNHQIPSPPPSPPSLEELSRRGVRSLFLPYIIGLISDSTPQQTPQSPREVLVLVNFRTGSITMVEGSGQIEAFLRGKEGPLPASKASIEALETVEVMEEGLECSICLTEFENKYEGAQNKEMPCGHRFHAPCIGKWLGIHGSCPICRYQMPPEDEKNSTKIEADNESELIDNIDDDDNEEEEEEEEDDETLPPPRGGGGGGDESDGFSGAGFVFHIYVAGSRRGESGLDLDPDEENSGSGSGSDMEIDDSD